MRPNSLPKAVINTVCKWALLGPLLLLAGNASFALQAGEIKLLSSLGKPLVAHIQLQHYQSLNPGQLIIKQAPSDIYQQMNVDESARFRDLSFNVDDKGVVHIRSRKPVNEPFLHFILKFQWPEGELYREYRLLIDPA